MLAIATMPSAVVPTLKLPGTGDKMPQIGYGTWLSAPGEVYEATKVAIDCGYRLIDEAWCYQNENEVGRMHGGIRTCNRQITLTRGHVCAPPWTGAIEEKQADGTIKREDLWITSKLWNNFHRPELVREGCMESLTALRTTYLDLYLIHFPVSFVPGCAEATLAEQVEHVPLADTWKAMEKLVDEGLVKNIGVSNFEIDELKQIQARDKYE